MFISGDGVETGSASLNVNQMMAEVVRHITLLSGIIDLGYALLSTLPYS